MGGEERDGENVFQNCAPFCFRNCKMVRHFFSGLIKIIIKVGEEEIEKEYYEAYEEEILEEEPIQEGTTLAPREKGVKKYDKDEENVEE